MTINEFFTNLASGATWAAGVAFQRSNPLPLDKYSVFQSEADLVTYVTTNAVAYPGQIVAVYDEEAAAMKAYVISSVGEDGAYVAVGSEIVVDGKSIVEKEDGSLEVAGFGEAASLTLPQKQSDGSIAWVSIDAIVQGDGNTKYTFTEKVTESNVTFDVKSSDDESAQTIHLDAYSKSEIDSKFDELPVYSVKEGEKILKLEGTEFSTVASLKYVEATEDSTAKIQLLGIDGALVSEIDATPFIRDGMLSDVEYNAENNKLIFTWNTEAGEKTDEVILSDIIEPYTAGNGLQLVGNEFSVKLDGESEGFLTVGENGVKLAGVQSAIDTAKQDAIDDAAEKYYTKTEVYTKSETENKIVEKINTVTGGESAADVKLALETYRDALNKEVWGDSAGEWTTTTTEDGKTVVQYNPAYGSQSRIDVIEGKLNDIAEGAQVNVIEAVKVNGTALKVTDKAVDITVPTNLTDLGDWSSLDERVTAAKAQADKGVTDAASAKSIADANTTAISELDTLAKANQTAIAGHLTRITTLENADIAHKAEYEALKGIVEGHTTALADKATKGELNDALGLIGANTSAIGALVDTTIPQLNSAIGSKANANEVYTKTEIGAITEGKTLVEMIQEAQETATYDDTEVRGLIADNKTAVEALYKEDESGNKSGLLVSEVARVEGLISAEVTRAQTEEGKLDARLKEVEYFWEEAIRDNGVEQAIDTLKELQDYITTHGEAAAKLVEVVDTHTDRLDAIYIAAEGETAAQGLLAEVQAQAEKNKQAIEAINNTETGVLALAKKYTDDAIDALPMASTSAPGLVKASEEVTVAEDGTMGLGKVSATKLYVPEGDELILNGGNAI